jgi:hypothetical protein
MGALKMVLGAFHDPDPIMPGYFSGKIKGDEKQCNDRKEAVEKFVHDGEYLGHWRVRRQTGFPRSMSRILRQDEKVKHGVSGHMSKR